MTASELRDQLYKNINSLSDKLPESIEVDHETYANIIQEILDNKGRKGDCLIGNLEDMTYYEYRIHTGTKHNGVLFKGVELILKSRAMMK